MSNLNNNSLSEIISSIENQQITNIRKLEEAINKECAKFNIKKELLERGRNLKNALFSHTCRKYLGMSYYEISDITGEDHSTAEYHDKYIQKILGLNVSNCEMRTQSNYREYISKLGEPLKEKQFNTEEEIDREIEELTGYSSETLLKSRRDRLTAIRDLKFLLYHYKLGISPEDISRIVGLDFKLVYRGIRETEKRIGSSIEKSQTSMNYLGRNINQIVKRSYEEALRIPSKIEPKMINKHTEEVSRLKLEEILAKSNKPFICDHRGGLFLMYNILAGLELKEISAITGFNSNQVNRGIKRAKKKLLEFEATRTNVDHQA